MQYGRLLRTLSHLRPTQVVYQVLTCLRKPAFTNVACPEEYGGKCGKKPMTPFIAKPVAIDGDTFTFLNLSKRFMDWDDKEFGMLWAYNLNYMDYLLQRGADAFEGKMWIDRFLRDLPARKVGLDPYPTALRMMNWAKFACLNYTDRELPSQWRGAIYSQLLHLEKRREYHLLGNHLLEDAFGLYIGWLFLGEKGMHLNAARRLMLVQLREQTLSDGAHYEQSPMYHCILLDRLLDALNFALTYEDEGAQELRAIAIEWLGWLESIVWQDGAIPLFGDAATGIAPTPNEIFDYARRLGLSWEAKTLGASGYRKLNTTWAEVMADVGGVTATYQPGHTHCDPLSFEMRINGRPFVVDTGISTYEKNARRQYERSYAAHNVAQIGDEEPFEVWGGFRVGRMASVNVRTDAPNSLEAVRIGRFKAYRTFHLDDGAFTIADDVFGKKAIARLHLAPGIEATLSADGTISTPLAEIRFEGEDVEVSLCDCQVSTAYNLFQQAVCVETHFRGTLTTTITPTALP